MGLVGVLMGWGGGGWVAGDCEAAADRDSDRPQVALRIRGRRISARAPVAPLLRVALSLRALPGSLPGKYSRRAISTPPPPRPPLRPPPSPGPWPQDLPSARPPRPRLRARHMPAPACLRVPDRQITGPSTRARTHTHTHARVRAADRHHHRDRARTRAREHARARAQVLRINIYQDQYLVAHTPETLLIGDLESCKLSEARQLSLSLSRKLSEARARARVGWCGGWA